MMNLTLMSKKVRLKFTLNYSLLLFKNILKNVYTYILPEAIATPDSAEPIGYL